MASHLPIEDTLPSLIAALSGSRMAVLQAPPGAGKTTRVPLAILDAGLTTKKIVMLEPRRLATRSAAVRMAETLGEQVGQTVGYRIRGDSKTSKSVRIEVVTEGILTRMIQADPSLSDIGAIIFDEFHERSLNADLGLALSLEIRSALRDDLLILVMSATLDAEPVAKMMGNAPLISAEGRSFPVEIVWRKTPLSKDARFDQEMAALIREAADSNTGGILAFLPGEGEIRRVADRLTNLDKPARILPLFGAMPFAAQRDVLNEGDGPRKIVLATSIAETSLTIPDIRVVVDGGLARRARFDPGSGMSRLVTERVSRAEAEQRTGRAGRVAPGACYRLWSKGEHGGLSAFPPTEIETADLARLALELAEWGSTDLEFLTMPPAAALNEARELLVSLGALEQGSITDTGREIARLPLHPRLAHMVLETGRDATLLASLLENRDPLRGAGTDLRLRLDALKSNQSQQSLQTIRKQARQLDKFSSDSKVDDPAVAAAFAYPDRIALRREGDAPRWLMSGGKGAKMDQNDPLAKERLLVVTDTDGDPKEATIRLAIPIAEASVRSIFAARIETVETVHWSNRDKRVAADIEERLGQIVLSRKTWRDAPSDMIAKAMVFGIRQVGLVNSDASERFKARVSAARSAGQDLPDMSDTCLLDELEEWLLPHLTGVRSANDWKKFDILPALQARLSWEQKQTLDQKVPSHYETPLGRRVAIEYSEDDPQISLKLQELFGVDQHPVVAGRPIRVTMLSPAGRPIQTTMDIPGFWVNSYADVRKDMRGRYPKHPWPEDPLAASPTTKATPRKR